MAKKAFLFPGQGAQHVGMGRDVYEAFPAARRVFDLAEEACGLGLKRLCFEGPEEELARTDICQPAIFTVSAAILAALGDLLDAERSPIPLQRDWSLDRLAEIRPAYVAGLSLGEYTALYAADAVDLAPAVRLVARRGELMQQAATAVPSGMVCVLGIGPEKAAELAAAAAEGEVLTCANLNCPGQVVLSGQAEACRRAEAMARDFGASGAVPLKVAGAFHSEIMAPAAERLAEALAEVEFRDPKMPVVANVDARSYTTAAEVPRKLLAQLTSPTRWQQSMEFLLGRGVDVPYEIGPGRVLAGLMRRIDRRAAVVSVNSRRALEQLAGAQQD